MGTRQEVILLASSGSGAMEAAVTNLLKPGAGMLMALLTAAKAASCKFISVRHSANQPINGRMGPRGAP